MADDLQFSSRSENPKRKFDDEGPPPTSHTRRPTGFSAPLTSENSSAPPSYNSVPPPMDEIQLAKQRAQEIAARLFSNAEAKRPRVENGEDAHEGGFSSSTHDSTQKPPGHHFPQAGMAPSPPVYGFQGSNKKIEIPNGRVGVIIGKAGETIKYLQLQSGARIQVTRDVDADPNSPSRMVELIGTAEQITKAEQLIRDVIAEAEAGGSGTISARKYGPGQAGTEQFSMKVPNNKVGLIIGKGGETIKNMQARSGARIQLVPLHLPPGDTSTERTMYIDGTPEQIESAKQLVNEVISDNRPRNPPMSGGYPQGGYRPPPAATNWGPSSQQPGYGGYVQPGSYPGPPPPYNMSQAPYGSYPPNPTSSGYSSGWDQTASTQQNTGYDYYNQQASQQQPPAGGSAPVDSSGYNYGQPPAANYTQPGYAESNYVATYQTATQPGYNQTQTTQQGYHAAPSYGGVSNQTPDGNVTSYGQTTPSQVPQAQQSPSPAQPSATTPTGYGKPPSSQQPPYGMQPLAQTGYSQAAPLTQPSYGQGQTQKQAPYGQAQLAPTSQGGYAQQGYVQPGYNQQDSTNTRPPLSAYGQTSAGTYGQPTYGAPPAGPAGYVQQPYNDSYGGGYAQPPVYSSDNSAAGNSHNATSYEAPPPSQPAQGVPPKSTQS